MAEVFTKSKWIWSNSTPSADEYAEFKVNFKRNLSAPYFLHLTADSVVSVKINGELVFFYTEADFAGYKYYDTVELTPYLKEENLLEFIVWYFGENNQTYLKGPAGLIFEVESNGEKVCVSNENVLSRKIAQYKNGYRKMVTPQLGFSFLYDATKQDLEFSKSVISGGPNVFLKREIKNLELHGRVETDLIKRENSIIIDLKKETAGLIDLDFVSEKEQKITFAFGEHIVDGGVRHKIGIRDFTFEYVAKKGENKYLNTTRRIACRYLEIFAESPIKINYIGIRPVFYPIEKVEKKFSDSLIQKIYDVSIDTLLLCMHEHYEDCPWREQGLYSLDSRNQMLFGYYAFKTSEYQRANLIYQSKGVLSHGLLAICFPSGVDLAIPSFSLGYILAVCEYVKHTGDKTILSEVGGVINALFSEFEKRIDSTGLIPSFPYPFWNFYEWEKDSNNESEIMRKKDEPYTLKYDLIINCFYVMVKQLYASVNSENCDLSEMKNKIVDTFYLKDKGVFKLSTDVETYSQLGNAFTILAGIKTEGLAEKILTDDNMISCTLSMRAFLYEALLKEGDKYKNFIISDIVKRYKGMLDKGATSFWETEKGEADFDGAGSLCHGWSAIPVYYFNVLGDIV